MILSATGFYKRQKRTREWDANETIKFYRCLHSVGTDFSLMLMLFPNRSRRDLKLKVSIQQVFHRVTIPLIGVNLFQFKKEEKTNLGLINKALLHPKEFNIDELKVDLEREEKELEQKKREWEELKQKHAKEKRLSHIASGRFNCFLKKRFFFLYFREQSKLLKQKNRKSVAARNIAGSETIYEHEFAVAPRKNRKVSALRMKSCGQTTILHFQRGAFVSNNNPSLPAFNNTFAKPQTEEKPTITVIKNEYLMPTSANNAAKNKVPMGPLSPQDILNMDIVFAGTENTDACTDQTENVTLPSNDEIIIPDSDTSFVFMDGRNELPMGKAVVKVESDEKNDDDEDEDDQADVEPDDGDSKSMDSLSMKELAVVASHSVDDPNNVIYEVYAVSAATGELSEKPLDLPPDVVEQIRMSIGV